MRDDFNRLSDSLSGLVTGSEVLLTSFSGERSDFVRFNTSAVRQGGSVEQRYLSVELIDSCRHASQTITLTGGDDDADKLARAVAELRAMLPHLPEDPYLLYATDVCNSEQIGDNRLGDSAEALQAILAAGKGRDLVGSYAAGEICHGFANSLGQRNYLSSHSFNFTWSFYHAADKAVKTQYAGFEFIPEQLTAKVAGACEQLQTLALPAKTVEPGEYRVYLAPAAVAELMGMISWGGFGLKAHRTKTTSLLRLAEGSAELSPMVTWRENTAGGLAANFGSGGFLKPPQVTLVDRGKLSGCLIAPRSAKEYGETTNGAGAGEFPESLEMSAGDLSSADVLGQLDTGVYVNQLWYTNYSDRAAGRITGMTRFATFWVDRGRIVAPLNVMRFDETVYRMFGENLLGLTAARDFIPDPETYEARSSSSMHLPGALIDRFRLTL